MSAAPLTGVARFGEPGRISPLIKVRIHLTISPDLFVSGCFYYLHNLSNSVTSVSYCILPQMFPRSDDIIGIFEPGAVLFKFQFRSSGFTVR